jgi:hypothetical protein
MSDDDSDIVTWSEHQAGLLRRIAAGEKGQRPDQLSERYGRGGDSGPIETLCLAQSYWHGAGAPDEAAGLADTRSAQWLEGLDQSDEARCGPYPQAPACLPYGTSGR